MSDEVPSPVLSDEEIRIEPLKHDPRSILLSCGKSSFARLREVIRKEANQSEDKFSNLVQIWLLDKGRMPEHKVPLSEKVITVGCSLFVVLFISAAVVGVVTVFKWLSGAV
jgi:hypothetical protein